MKHTACKSSGQKLKDQKREFWVCGLLLCVAAFLYHTLYFNSILPVSEGWGIYYVELLDRGQIPYRDFAYYLPPLNLLIDWVFWKLSFGYMLAFRGWYLLQRIVIAFLLYKLMTKWFAPRISWIVVLTGVCLGSSSVYDLCGDYNQTQTMFIVLLAYLVAGFLEQDGEGSKAFRRRMGLLFVSGVFLSLMTLLKQSLGLAAVLFSFLFLVIYCTVFHDKNFFWYCAVTAAGAVIPLGMFAVVLAASGATIPFLEQFFGAAGAKGGTGTILLNMFKIAEVHSLQLFCLFLLVLFTGQRLLTHGGKYHKWIFLLALCSLVLSLYISYNYHFKEAAKTLLTFFSLDVILALLMLLSVFFYYCHRKPSLQKIVDWNYTLPFMAYFCGILLCVYINYEYAFTEFYYRSELYDPVTSLINQLCRYINVGFVAYYLVIYKTENRYLYAKSILALALCGLIDIGAANAASGGDPIPREMFTSAPILVALLFSFKLPKWEKAKNYAVCLLCVFICMLCMLQKYTGAYSWWGTDHLEQLDARTESVEVDALAGFRLSEQKKTEYEEIVRIIEENGNEDSTVWGFPHVKIFNILTNHYNVMDPVPVLFYDVCSDEMADKELGWLRESLPDFVIWCDIPYCLDVHENTFRNGERLGQREIVKWFNKEAARSYNLVGQAGNLFVYQLKSLPKNYSYFQDRHAINVTINNY